MGEKWKVEPSHKKASDQLWMTLDRNRTQDGFMEESYKESSLEFAKRHVGDSANTPMVWIKSFAPKHNIWQMPNTAYHPENIISTVQHVETIIGCFV